MLVKFHYFTQKNQWDPKGYMALDLEYVFKFQGNKDKGVYPIANLKKFFKILHDLASTDVRNDLEQQIAQWFKKQYKEIKSRENQPSEQLLNHLNYWQAVLDGKEETQMSKKAVKKCYDQARNRIDEIRFSKKDAKLMKRLESMKKAFIDSCKWKGEIF